MNQAWKLILYDVFQFFKKLLPFSQQRQNIDVFYIKNKKNQKRYCHHDEKALAHEMARLTRAERTHRLCTRGGMLETFIREPSLLTDGDVMELLTFLFHGEAAQKKLRMLIERRRETAGRETY